jgi:phospholipase D-like protein
VNYPLLDVFLTMFFLFMWILWIFLVIRIAISIFASHDLSGWGKAGWLVLVILVPFIGVVVYVIARGSQLANEQIASGGAPQDESFRTYERYMQRG